MAIDTNLHPGVTLRKFLSALDISAYRVAQDIGVPVNRITAILNEERSITPETSVLLGRYLDLYDDSWALLQTRYDIEGAKAVLLPKIQSIESLKY